MHRRSFTKKDAHGYLSEGQNRLETILALLETGPAIAGRNARRASVLLGAGQLANDQADYPAARSYCEQSQAIYQELGDKRGVALAAAGQAMPLEQAIAEALN
jgi:hypothetical protein